MSAERRAPPKSRPARIWSVGCSDGAELYSIALLLSELGVLGRCELLGTDCRPDAIERAREGVYDAAAVGGLPKSMIRRYFRPVEPLQSGFNHYAPPMSPYRAAPSPRQVASRWQVAAELRHALRWRTADALTVREPGEWDLILCRNVSIYLQPEATRDLWSRLTSALRPGGVIMLGKAERPATRGLAPIGNCLYRRCDTDHDRVGAARPVVEAPFLTRTAWTRDRSN